MKDEPAGEQPPGRPRPRRHRRVSRPATTGHPDAGHWTKDAADRVPEPREVTDPDEQPPRRVAGSDGGPESVRDRWWREQRPPHWS